MLKLNHFVASVLAFSAVFYPVSTALAINTVVNSPVAGSSDPLTIRKAFQLEKDPPVSLTLRNASAEAVLRTLAQRANMSLVFMSDSGSSASTSSPSAPVNPAPTGAGTPALPPLEDDLPPSGARTSAPESVGITIPYLELRSIPLSEAFALVLQMTGLVARRVYNTLLITTPQKMEQMGFSAPVIKTYTIYNQMTGAGGAGGAGAAGAAPAAGGATGGGGLQVQLDTIFKSRGLVPAPKIILDTRTTTLILIGTQEAIDIADRMIPILDQALPQVMIEVKLIELTKRGSEELGFAYGFSQGKFGVSYNQATAGAAVAPVLVGGEGITLNPINNLVQNPQALGNPATGTDRSGISFNSLADFAPNFNVRLNALIQNSQARVLTSPRMAIQHGVRGMFDSTTEVPILSTTVTATAATETVQNINIGERMEITPFIDVEQGLITMRVRPDISTRGQTVSVGGQTVPERGRRMVETTLRVRDGESAIIGGLMRTVTNEQQSKVPVLGDIPVLGSLFTNTRQEKEDVEVLIMLTPRIIKNE
jgi:type II secretory pathway component HofQ